LAEGGRSHTESTRGKFCLTERAGQEFHPNPFSVRPLNITSAAFLFVREMDLLFVREMDLQA
jgi:hypothetical protein